MNSGIIIDQDGSMKSDPEDMSEIINSQYKTSWRPPKEPLTDADEIFPDEESSNEGEFCLSLFSS